MHVQFLVRLTLKLRETVSGTDTREPGSETVTQREPGNLDSDTDRQGVRQSHRQTRRMAVTQTDRE